MADEIVRYKSADGESIELTQAKVARYMVSGDARNVTDAEFMRFMQLCKANRLNPFVNEAYLVKYGDSPATIVPSKEVFTKRAYRNERFKGMEAGVTVVSNGRLVQRPGCVTLKGETLVGGWCKVHVEGYAVPIYEEVPLSEYNTGKSSWKKMPGTMIRKVAMCHALREAFPEDLGGLYDSSEMGADDAPAPQPQGEPIPARAEVVREAPEPGRPARLDALRGLMAQAKRLGILVRDKADPNAGLLGWVWATYGVAADEIDALSDAQVAEVEAHARQVIADRQALEAAEQARQDAHAGEAEYEAAELADHDIAF